MSRPKGYKHTEESKRKMSRSQKGRVGYWRGKKRPEHSAKLKGRKITEEHKRRISKGHMGIKPNKETRKKLRASRVGKKTSKETKEKLSRAFRGNKSHLWRGGISFEPYTIDWTRTLRRSIRERDHYTCQLCGKSQEDRALDVHHIDYDKKNCNPDNLITLCWKCHPKTGINREYWIRFFGDKK